MGLLYKRRFGFEVYHQNIPAARGLSVRKIFLIFFYLGDSCSSTGFAQNITDPNITTSRFTRSLVLQHLATDIITRQRGSVLVWAGCGPSCEFPEKRRRKRSHCMHAPFSAAIKVGDTSMKVPLREILLTSW